MRPSPSALPAQTSQLLQPGRLYSRPELQEMLKTTDTTINTGVFRPAGSSSIWLFITEEKGKDITQYKDKLDGDTLYWQGQLAGRTDQLVITHEEQGRELLVFHRKSKREHPGCSFRYLGEFYYHSHSGSGPTSYVLHRQASR